MEENIYPAQFESLDAIRDFVAATARAMGMDEKEVYNIQLAVDEAASNIIEHAYAGIPDGEITVRAENKNRELVIVMLDRGRSFDSDSVGDPNLSDDIEDRSIGGLGLYFMRRLMDDVTFESRDGINILTMRKRLAKAKKRSDQQAGWADIVALGDKVLAATTLAEQRDFIVELARELMDGEIRLWLDEKVFRLPSWVENLFDDEPPTEALKMAVSQPNPINHRAGEQYSVAIRLSHGETVLGAIEVLRADGTRLSRTEFRFLRGLARAASVALLAWHRIIVERWRIGQLNLVRSVSAEIAKAQDVDELAPRVAKLIQNRFKYYYVALFTVERNQTLRFRSSAGGATRKRGRPTSPVLEVKMGQGLIGHVAQVGEEILCNDVRQEPRFRPVDSLPETLSEIVIPLKSEDTVLGVLDIQSDKLDAFHPNDLLVLRALADNIAVAIEGVILYNDLQRRAEQMRVVAEVSKHITSILNLRELMQEVASIVQQRFNYPYVHLFTVHPNRRQIHYEAGSGVRSAALEGYVLSLDDADGIVPWVARNGQTVLANDVEKEERYRPSLLPPANTRSELAVPLMFSGQVYGVLDVQSDELNAFSEGDQILFETLADAIAAAIRNADLYRSEQWRRQVADSLREVAGLLSANATLDQVLDTILTELERNLPSDIAAIWLLDDEDIHLAAVHGAPALEIENARLSDPTASTWLTSALLARQPVIRKSSDPIGPTGLAAGFNPDYSAIAAPLRIGDQPVGVLTLSHHTPGRYGHEAQAMTTTFASYAAVAIENARLYDAAQQQAYASAALLQVAQAVVSLSELDDILATIVRVLPILVGVERAVLYRLDESSGTLIPSQEYDLPEDVHPVLWRNIPVAGFPLAASAIASGLPAFSDKAHLGPVEWLHIQPPEEIDVTPLLQSEDRLLMAFPLLIKDVCFGVLVAEEALGARRFRNRRVEILTGVTQQVALAIQNDLFLQEGRARERLETEVQLARQIQQTFLPDTLPAEDGWELSARWRTAREVGGDFYDAFELPNRKIGLFIADVADKGVPAALFMALTRTLVRAAVREIESPAQALARVNALLYPDCEQGMFVTAVYGVLDTITGHFTYANAGHNPPLFITPQAIERLGRTGIALGVSEDIPMEEKTIQLQPDDLLLLYTDGVTEAHSPTDELFGEDRLLAIAAACCAGTTQKILDTIEFELDAFSANLQPSDDVTMIAIRRLA